MIYKKDANFPYPILAESSVGYKEDHTFQIAVQFEEDADHYRFSIQNNMTSVFLRGLIEKQDASYLLVIQGKDNQFFPLAPERMYVDIPQNKISLKKRTSIQLHIVSNKRISFTENLELTPFYNQFKHEVTVEPYSMLGFSNVVTFEGGMKNPTELFEKRLNPELSSAIKFELESEFIVIEFKEEAFQLQAAGPALLNPFLYTGLRVALERFVRTYANEDEDYVDLEDIEEPTDLLDYKLHHLMVRKLIEEINFDNIDEVISKISSGVMEKYVKAVEGLRQHEED